MSDSPAEEARIQELRKSRRQQEIQRQLDEALEATFPASDPVSIVTSDEEEDWGAEAAEPAPMEPSAPGPNPPD